MPVPLFTHVRNRFPPPSLGNGPLQYSPTYGREQITGEGVDDAQRQYYVVTSIYNGQVHMKRRVPIEQILKNVSPAELEHFERKLDQHEARLLTLAVKSASSTRIVVGTADGSIIIRPQTMPDAAAAPTAKLGGNSENPSVVPALGEFTKTPAVAAPEHLRGATVLLRRGAPKPRKDQIRGASSPVRHFRPKRPAEIIEQNVTSNEASASDVEESPKRVKRADVGSMTAPANREFSNTSVSNIASASASASKPVVLASDTVSTPKKRGRGRPSKKASSPVRVPPTQEQKGKARVTISNSLVPAAIPADEISNDVYEVEAVINDRLIDGVRLYKVKWAGYTDTTWEMPDALGDAGELVGEYWAAKKINGSRMNEAAITLLTLSSSDDESQMRRLTEKQREMKVLQTYLLGSFFVVSV